MKKQILAMLGVAVLAAAAGSALAKDSNWQKNHPRREEVNNRLKNQNKRINQGVKSGKLTKGQAKELRQNDKNIRQEERAMASQNGGHITKAEQKALNQQENQNSKAIYGEKHPAGQ